MTRAHSLRRTAAAAPHVVWSVLFIVAPLLFVLYYAFTDKDVVRHKLVQRIIRAYEKYEKTVAQNSYNRSKNKNNMRHGEKTQ